MSCHHINLLGSLYTKSVAIYVIVILSNSVETACRHQECSTYCAVLSFTGVRHPEELSLMRKIDREALKRNQGVSATRRTQIPGMVASPNGHAPVNTSYDSGTGTLGSPYRTSSTPQVCIQLGIKNRRSSACMLSLA